MTKIETVKSENPEIFRLNVNGYLADGYDFESSGHDLVVIPGEGLYGQWWAIVKQEDEDDES